MLPRLQRLQLRLGGLDSSLRILATRLRCLAPRRPCEATSSEPLRRRRASDEEVVALVRARLHTTLALVKGAETMLDLAD
jgi:hypothetical protein